MIKIDNHTTVDLDAMARTYYDFLNPYRINPVTIRHPDGSLEKILVPFKKSLLGRIDEQLDLATTAGKQDQIDFWEFLLAKKAQVLRLIIYGRPSIHKKLIDKIDLMFGPRFLSVSSSYTESKLTEFGKIVAGVFDYSTQYRQKDTCVSNCRTFALGFCTYCNVIPVEIVSFPVAGSLVDRKQALHQLDHFYPQVRYPYLALSFFNLIPGCAPCNSQLKGEKDFTISTHFNPFDKSFDDIFEFGVNTLLPVNLAALDINIKNPTGHSTKAIDDFKILERYNQNHKQLVFDLLSYLTQHPPAVSISHMNQFPNLFPNQISAHNSNLKAIGVPLERKFINAYPLGKIKRDLCKSLNMIPD